MSVAIELKPGNRASSREMILKELTMSDDTKQSVNKSSAAIREGIRIDLAADDLKNSQASNELGNELRVEPEGKKPMCEDLLFKAASTPLFMRDSPEGKKGNSQDEKDASAE